MDGQLKPGTILTSSCSTQYTVERLIAAGGQGEVYDVVCGGRHYALKWYFAHTATPEQRAILEDLIQRGSPDSCFLWPLELVFEPRSNRFGYIMYLYENRFKSIYALMKNQIDPTFSSLLRTAYNMTYAYEKLHAKGLCYRDISFGNVAFDPDTGDVIICDIDNISPSNAAEASVQGTQKFMAPEIVRGEARPSRETDLFSLSVLMFYMFMVAHPLEGQLEANIICLDLPAMKRLYGTNPVFIYDPANSTNRPVPGYHDNAIESWNKIYPQQLKDAFTKAFTVGLNSPNERITEKEWLRILANSISGIFRCPRCGCELFYDERRDNHTCWKCGQVMRKPAVLAIEKNQIVLWRNMKIYSHHIRGDYDMTTVVGSPTQNPQNPQQRGIRNDSTENWIYIRADGSQVLIPPGASAAIAQGTKINFGQVVGEFQ